MTMYEYRATVVSVYDGDTITLDIDLGFYIHVKKVKMRLAGINAPEMVSGAPPGMEARDYLRSLLPVGSSVTIKTIKDRQEKYGRFLVYVYNPLDVNHTMVLMGYAVPYMVEP